LKIEGDKLQALAGLSGDQFVMWSLWTGTGLTEAQPGKTLVPQGRIGRQIVLLNAAPIVLLKFPERLLSG